MMKKTLRGTIIMIIKLILSFAQSTKTSIIRVNKSSIATVEEPIDSYF